MSTAAAALDNLDKSAWSTVDAKARLALLLQIRDNLYARMEDLAAAEAKVKTERLNGNTTLFTADACKITTAVPMANNINGAIDLYTALAASKPFVPAAGAPKIVTNGKATTQDGKEEALWDVPVCPNTWKETFFYATRKDKLRCIGEPKQIYPHSKQGSVVVILGAGNYSSAVEIIKALFFDNHVAVHKPHPINEKPDEVWAQILAPLVAAKALAFCTADQGPALTKDERVQKIYFTGGVETAKAILKGLPPAKSLVCEAGGVNPVLVVPAVWTTSQIQHHAQQIVTAARGNGGHVCARPQVVVTSKAWPQRQEFLDALHKAAKEEVFAQGQYYPTAAKTMQEFQSKYPDATPIQPENGAHGTIAEFLLLPDEKPDGYVTQHEAFTQVLAEVGLETENDAADFFAKAVPYVNQQVTGSLCVGILIPDATRKTHADAYEQAVTDLEYGSIGTNLLPIHIFFSQYTVWGVKEQDYFDKKELASGNGNFGNVFGFQNVQKTIIEDAFVSPLQLKFLNKKAISDTIAAMAQYAVMPTWYNLFRFFYYAVPGMLKGKDW